MEIFIDEILDAWKKDFSITIFSTPYLFEIEGIFISSSDDSISKGLEFEQITHIAQKNFMDYLKKNSKVSSLFGSDLLPLFDKEFGFSVTFQKLAVTYKEIQFNHLSKLLLNELDISVR